jgi:hypothetical protein
VPEGTPPDDLQALYYVADNAGVPELCVLGMDAQGRRWTEPSRATDLPLEVSPWGPYVSGMYPSPDSTRLAVDVVFGESCSVSVFGVGEGSIHALHEGYEGCHGEWFPDGERILLGRAIINVLTGQSEEIVLPDEEGAYIAGISLHPDSTRVAYALVHLPTKSAEMPYTEIWVTNIGKTVPELLLKEEGVMGVYTLSWSPKGDMLAYVIKPDFGPVLGELEVVDMNGNVQALGRDVPEPGTRYGPVWGLGEQNLAFVRADQPQLFLSDWREPGTNMYVVDLLTGKTKQISHFEARRNDHPTWSPDGKLIAFSSNVFDGDTVDTNTVNSPEYGEIWVASVDGSAVYAISGMAWPGTPLAWLP